jgi:hypothetical protein
MDRYRCFPATTMRIASSLMDCYSVQGYTYGFGSSYIYTCTYGRASRSWTVPNFCTYTRTS